MYKIKFDEKQCYKMARDTSNVISKIKHNTPQLAYNVKRNK